MLAGRVHLHLRAFELVELLADGGLRSGERRHVNTSVSLKWPLWARGPGANNSDVLGSNAQQRVTEQTASTGEVSGGVECAG